MEKDGRRRPSYKHMSNLRILIIGAHPDDCDICAGGTAAIYRSLGHEVRFVSVTNGQSGHQQMYGPTLTARRTEEAARAGRVIGVQYDVLEFPDGGLQPTLEARYRIIRLIREFGPDLILTHRPNDYHPDHRYTSQIVCDAAYMVMVPAVVPSVSPCCSKTSNCMGVTTRSCPAVGSADSWQVSID